MRYAGADRRARSSGSRRRNRRKLGTIARLLKRHDGELVLTIGQYLKQLQQVATVTGAPIITGKTPNDERAVLYGKFKPRRDQAPDRVQGRELRDRLAGRVRADPDLGHVREPAGGRRSGSGASCGPNRTTARRTSTRLVTRDTVDQDFAQNRQLFLTEQGY